MITKFFNAVLVSALVLGWLPRARAQIVKVTSFACGAPARPLTGSGTVINTSQGKKVVTSSHVVFHGDRASGICASVSGASPEPCSVHLERVNFARGLALLALDCANQDKISALAMDQLAPEPPLNGEQTVLAGYALGRAAPLFDERGHVLADASERSILPLIDTVFEIDGAHSEYGMSGGALLSQDRTRYLGMISHQYLRITPGQPTTAGIYTPGSGGENASDLVALVIPARAVREWLDAAARGGAAADLRLDLASQLAGLQVATIDGLRFAERSCANGSGGVGGEGVGIGGEGVGIGGADTATGPRLSGGTPKEPCSIEIRATGALSQAWPFQGRPWLEHLEQRLVVNQSVFFQTLVLGEERRPVQNLLQAFTLIQRGYTPLNRPLAGAWIYAPGEEELARWGQASQSALQRLEASFADASAAAAARGELFAHLELVAAEAQGGEASLIDETQLENALDQAPGARYEGVWRELFNQDFDGTLELKKALLQVQELLLRLP